MLGSISYSRSIVFKFGAALQQCDPNIRLNSLFGYHYRTNSMTHSISPTTVPIHILLPLLSPQVQGQQLHSQFSHCHARHCWCSCGCSHRWCLNFANSTWLLLLALLSSAREVRGAVAEAVKALRRRRSAARSRGEARPPTWLGSCRCRRGILPAKHDASRATVGSPLMENSFVSLLSPPYTKWVID
jgi:hypothetical protein